MNTLLQNSGIFANILPFLSLMVGLSVLIMVMGLRGLLAPAQPDDRVQQWIGTGQGMPTSLREIEMRDSFFNRAIQPVIVALLKLLGQLVPHKNIDNLHRKLEMAGFPGNLGVMDFLGLKILGGVFFGVVSAALVYIIRGRVPLMLIGTGLSFGFFGFMLPNAWLSLRVATRQKEILKALPDALDMLVICVDAGLGLSGAMQRVVESWNNALVDEFARVLAEVKLGRTRAEALEGMSRRTGVNEVANFVMALTLADKLGVSIAQVLHLQAQQIRVARRQRIEELAREASIKMLFPLVFLIFPSMFAVILGPAVPLLLDTLTGL